ncbi:hypothetical protein [Pseudonocardia sp. H11422]|uniref:hypothetical protein n=1 Tax=Pseudonocardia sp. H11422 TaxID=2835866 RepID=UPI001BDC51F1|nr:hypothetical protein [Pseudonocardia sp. H11422]
MTEQPTNPHFGEETDGEPTQVEGEQTASGAGTDEERNPDLHGTAREVAESGHGDDPADTPGGG